MDCVQEFEVSLGFEFWGHLPMGQILNVLVFFIIVISYWRKTFKKGMLDKKGVNEKVVVLTYAKEYSKI